MASPVADSYSASVDLYAGRMGPPSWRRGAPLNVWSTIPGTEGAGDAGLQEYSSFVKVGTKAYCSLCGGHGIGDNRTTSIDLGLDQPVWVQESPPSPPEAWRTGVGYYADGMPAARHVRFLAYYIPSMGIVHLSARDIYGQGSSPTMDVWDMQTKTWSAAGTYPNHPIGVSGGGFIDLNGDGWAADAKFSVATKTWSIPTLTGGALTNVRYPWTTTPSYMFGFCWGDGWGAAAGGINAVRQVGNHRVDIAFNDSPGKTQFNADGVARQAIEAGMAYDPINNYFLYYSGLIAGRFYRITPNSGTVWDIEVVQFAVPASAGGTQNRLQWFAEFNCFILKPSDASPFYFFPTAA